MNLKSLGKLFSDARINGRLSQEDLAAKASVSTRTVQRLENGETDPTFATMYSIAKAAGWKLLIILGDSNEEELLRLFRDADPTQRKALLGLADTFLKFTDDTENRGRLKKP